MPASAADDPFIRIIEGTKVINGRYHNPQRLPGAVTEGYFSLIFTAHDSRTSQDIALKFFHPKHDRDQYRRESFSREAQLLAEFSRQNNILQLVEGEQLLAIPLTTEAGGIPIPFQMSYFATELASGSLNDYIYSDANNPLDSLLFFKETCKGVQRMHRSYTCHRDLKPGNCLIFPSRIVKLSDFGTARRIGEVGLATRYDEPVGDIRYTALELFCGMGNNAHYFYGADFFSLGAILFELFTRQILTQLVYDFSKLSELREFFGRQVPDHQRAEHLHTLIPNILAKWQLPELHTVEHLAPPSIEGRLNQFYKRLADLDYRNRTQATFEWIFREIEICLKILRNEEKYQRLLDLRKARRLNHKLSRVGHSAQR